MLTNLKTTLLCFSTCILLSACAGSDENPFATANGTGGVSGSGETAPDTATTDPFASVTLISADQANSSTSSYGRIQTSDDSTTTVFTETFDADSNNPSGLEQLFKIVAGGTITQLTSFTVALNDLSNLPGGHYPVLSASGSHITWIYNSDPLSTNADGNTEIFSIDSNGTTLLQVTNSTGAVIESNQPSITADGSLITFVSNEDLDPPNNVGNFYQIFTIQNTTPAPVITQITNTTEATNTFIDVEISVLGDYVSFSSTGDLLGTNTGNTNVIYTINIDGSNLVQQTPDTTPSASNIFDIKSSSGNFIAFTSDADLTGANADNSFEIFTVDKGSDTLQQVTSNWLIPLYDAAITAILDGAVLYDYFDISGDGTTLVYLEEAPILLTTNSNIELISVSNAGTNQNTDLVSDIVASSPTISTGFLFYPNTNTGGTTTTILSSLDLGQGSITPNSNIFSVTP